MLHFSHLAKLHLLVLHHSKPAPSRFFFAYSFCRSAWFLLSLCQVGRPLFLVFPMTQSVAQPYANHWHLDKNVNLGHLLTTIGMVAAMFTWGSNVEKRIALIEQNQAQIIKRQDSDTAEIKEYLKEIRAEIKELRRLGSGGG